jgi:hypothetical protein
VAVVALSACLDGPSGDPSDPGDPFPVPEEADCPELLRATPGACAAPAEARLALRDCEQPFVDIPFPAPLSPDLDGYDATLAGAHLLTVHPVECLGGTLEGQELGRVAYAIVATYVRPTEPAPDALFTLKVHECVVDSPYVAALWAHVGFPCSAGEVDVVDGTLGMGFVVRSASFTYEGEEALFQDPAGVEYDTALAQGPLGGGTVLLEHAVTTWSDPAPLSVSAQGGILGGPAGRAVHAGANSQARGGTVELQAVSSLEDAAAGRGNTK